MLLKYFFSKESNPNHFKALDGLRAIAVLLVMFAHSSHSIFEIHFLPFLDFNALGKTGVYLFFILSSYLLDRQIILALQSGRDDIKYWINYFLRRFLRIYPLFIFTLSLYYLIPYFGYKYCICIVDINDFWHHISLQKAKGVFWSIPVEFKYYFLSPLIMFMYDRLFNWKLNYISIGTFSLIVLVIIYNKFTGFNVNSSSLNTINYLPIFLLGSYLAFIEIHYKNALENLSKNASIFIDILGVISLITCLVLGGSFFYQQIFGASFKFKLFSLFRNEIILQGFFLTILLCSAKYGYKLIPSILGFVPLRFLGVISFSIYLFHYPVLKLVNDFTFTVFASQLKFILYLLITIFVSVITYLLIEFPSSQIRLYQKQRSK